MADDTRADLCDAVRAALLRHGIVLPDAELADVAAELAAILRGREGLDQLALAAVEPTTFVRFDA
ncbi:MAG: hypothetical protein HY691_13295 [Chloroflexi bacterium]|nr:hypothetical protein [Chloroflexota bacterium]